MDSVSLEPSHVALVLLRLAIRRFEAALTPRVKQWARETWGDEPQGVAAEERERLKTKHDYVPRWAQKCRKCLSKDFARTFHSDYLDEWDAYRLGEVIQRHLDAFKPPPARASDAASEIYRNRVHHVGFLRNSLAHPSLGQPSVSECLAGSKAVLEVLRAHGEGVGEAALALPLLQRIAEAERRAEPGSPSSVMSEGTPLVVDLTVELSDEQLRHSVLESALQHAAAALGGAICERWEGVPPPWLKLPMDLAGTPPGGGKSICAVLMSHGKELKKRWPAAAKKKASLEPLMGKAGALLAARHDREHGKLDRFDWARVGGLVCELAGAFDSLQLPAGRMRELAAARGGAAVAVPVNLRGPPSASSLRIGFRDPRGAHGYLVGRDSLVEEVAALLRDSAHCVAALHGESGAGKTVAAIAVGFATQAELPWQEFMQGSSPLTFRQELARFARTHATGLAADAEEEEAVEAARRHFAESSGWLLIVDDIGAGEAALAGVLALLPRGSDGRVAGRVLLTSQRREAWPEEVAAWEVGGLSTDESMQLLAAGRPPIGDAIMDDEEVGMRCYLEEELSSGQGGAARAQLPLDVALLKSAFVGLQDKKGPDGAVTETALEQARGVMRRWRAEPMPSLEEAHDVQKRCVRRRHGAVRELIRRLDECGLEVEVGAARSLLAMLSVLNADGVPSRLFASREGLGEGSGMGGGALFGDSGSFAPAAAALEAVGLVRIEGGGALHMHQLVQRSARHVLTRAPTAEELLPERSLAEWGALLAVLRRRFASRAHRHSHREEVDALQPCAEALHEAGVLSPLGQAGLAHGLGGWHRDKGGMAHWEVGEALLREAMATTRETFGDRHPDTLTSIDNLGSLLEAKGDLDGAEALYREALVAMQETLGDKHPNTLSSINNLGTLLGRDKGDLDGAEALYREALVAMQETLGDKHPSTLTSIKNLGGLLYVKGDLDGAEPLSREAVEAQRETLGDRHPNTLVSISNLGMLLKDKGDLDGAEPLSREALEAQRETLGDRHPDTLVSINNLGLLLQKKGDLDGAEPLSREALEAQRETLGDRHPNTLVSINNLGLLLYAKGDLGGAEALYREALKGFRETLGDRHPSTLGSINNLGTLLQKKGDLDGAEPLSREALEGFRAVLGDSHPNTRAALQVVLACKRALAASRPKQGPNERCACGSGLKFKRCHGKAASSA